MPACGRGVNKSPGQGRARPTGSLVLSVRGSMRGRRAYPEPRSCGAICRFGHRRERACPLSRACPLLCPFPPCGCSPPILPPSSPPRAVCQPVPPSVIMAPSAIDPWPTLPEARNGARPWRSPLLAHPSRSLLTAARSSTRSALPATSPTATSFGTAPCSSTATTWAVRRSWTVFCWSRVL